MDAFFLHLVVQELQRELTGARIDKIHQPEPQTILLRLWNGRQEKMLLLCAAPGRARLHLSTEKRSNPPAPPRFCQLLRARFKRLDRVEQAPGERIVHLYGQSRETGDCLLAVELLGSQADLILVGENGRVIDSLRRRDSGGRNLQPGEEYLLPPPPQVHPLAAPLPIIPPEAREPSAFAVWLRKNVSPMSPLAARDLAAAVASGRQPVEVLEQIRQNWLRGEVQPGTGIVEGKPVLFAIPPSFLPLEDSRFFTSPSAAAEDFYRFGLYGGQESGPRKELYAALERERKRLERRMKRIEEERPAPGSEQAGRRLGELLLNNLHLVRPGMAEIVVDDLFADPPLPVTIPLDPRLSPQENAGKLFRGYRKKKSGSVHGERRAAETREALEWLDGAVFALEEATSPAELEDLRHELVAAGLISPPVTPRRRPPALPGIREGVTPGGFRLYWGKSHLGNDRVSRELTGADDLWFHARGVPGSHLVLKRGARGGEVPELDQLYAAAVAAGFSRAKNAGKTEVMVTEGKWVRRPKGARPGLVTVEHYRTVMVEPLRPEES